MAFLNKVVVITGGGSGFGATTALQFADLSARLSLIDIDEENLKKSAEICEKAGRTKVLTIKADLTKDEEVQQAIEKTVKEYGRIDVLVNNAGIGRGGTIIDDDVLKNFDQAMAINMRAIVATCHYAAPHLIETKGNIVNISSAAVTIVGTNVPYSVSKACVSHYTRCLALELAFKGVRVNAIQPSACETPILRHFSKTAADNFCKAAKRVSPMQKLIKMEDIAEMIVFLASDKANSITGVNYCIDTGTALSGWKVSSKYLEEEN